MSIKNPGAGMMASSPRPKKRPAGMKNPAEMKSSMRPKTRSDYETEKDVEAAVKGYKAGGMISEYGGKEKYSSKASMMKHEKAESPSVERGEEKMAKGGKLKIISKGGKKVPAFAADGVGKMAMGGMCRGMGAATKGGKYKA